MADMWAGNAGDDKVWAQDERRAEIRKNIEIELAWMQYRSHTDRLAKFFRGANLGRKMAGQRKPVDAQRLSGFYATKPQASL